MSRTGRLGCQWWKKRRGGAWYEPSERILWLLHTNFRRSTGPYTPWTSTRPSFGMAARTSVKPMRASSTPVGSTLPRRRTPTGLWAGISQQTSTAFSSMPSPACARGTRALISLTIAATRLARRRKTRVSFGMSIPSSSPYQRPSGSYGRQQGAPRPTFTVSRPPISRPPLRCYAWYCSLSRRTPTWKRGAQWQATC